MTSELASPGTRLRRLLAEPQPTPLMGAHDGLSARIAAEAGFPALWASGLCMSTTLGVRDSDEASWSDLLGLVMRVVEAADLPVLVDGDTGYGNFNTARTFTARAERIGAAGVCFEDKVFPKMNSFFGDSHALVPVDEFSGMIRACRDILRDPEFVIVARTEAFVADAGAEEALRRTEAYRKAGADAVFIHSRSESVDEIAQFMEIWHDRLPVVIAPTTFYRTPPEVFANLGISAVIWANQSLRSAVAAMRRACRVLRTEGPVALEEEIAPLDVVFRLMDYKGLTTDQERYRA
ncbi:isocitrate lyase/phosphoenolpyruvate mutase family protein [Streptomyces sp. SCSIO 30461]|uniref:isocitrate lyase/phosphoenolpyruvate mutase family protein n=1 Tax=Streptomyces sp. SCSIO 30461 TaxID=3118085 RepID=UPI0030CAC831